MEQTPSSSNSASVNSSKPAENPKPKITRPFFHEYVAGWKYRGIPYKGSFTDGTVQTKLMRRLWHEIKQLTGKQIEVTVKLLSKEKPSEVENTLEFTICQLSYSCNGLVSSPCATIEVYTVPGENTYFTFNITDGKLAMKNEITVRILKQACEIVFDTIVLRCEKREGGPLGAISDSDDDDDELISDDDE